MSMKVLRTVEGQKSKVQTSSITRPSPNEVLVKIHVVGQNPTDWKHVAYLSSPDVIVGCDFAGEIEEANGSKWKKGDRVSGMVHGGAYEDRGAFAEYTVADPNLLFQIPEGTTFEQAAAYPIPWMTAALALYQSLALAGPLDKKKSEDYVLIYGASSAVGIQAVQLAVLSGYRVIATASPKNHEFVKSLGAEKVFDYKSESLVDDIKAYSKSSIKYGLDTISEKHTIPLASDALASNGTLVLLLPSPVETRKDVKIVNILAYTTMGKAFKYGPNGVFARPEVPEDKEFAEKWWPVLTQLLEQKKIKEIPLKRMKGGLNGIEEGFEYMKSGKVSAEKLVYQIAETA